MTALHVRILKKLEAGKGGMTLERHALASPSQLGAALAEIEAIISEIEAIVPGAYCA